MRYRWSLFCRPQVFLTGSSILLTLQVPRSTVVNAMMECIVALCRVDPCEVGSGYDDITITSCGSR